MEKNFTTKTLSAQIRRHIGVRIFLCLVLLSFLMIFIVICDSIDLFKTISYKLNNECQYLSDYIVSQILVKNDSAIEIKLNTMNRSVYHYYFFPQAVISSKDHYKNMIWNFPISWSYNYPVQNIDGEYFGYIRISGNILSDSDLILKLVNRFLILCFFLIAGAYLLYPLNHKIPRHLFLTPLRNLLYFLKNRDNSCQINRNESYEIYQIQCEIIQLMEQLQSQSQEAAFGQMAAQVAHDIRSPLSVLSMSLELIQNNISLEDYRTIQDAVESVRDIANNLLTRYRHSRSFYHLEETKISPVCLPYLQLESVISQKRHEWHAEMNFSMEVSPNIKTLWCCVNPMDLKRILSNVLNNSYEAGGNKIILKLTTEVQENITFVVIKIIDNGRGIPAEQLHLVTRGTSTKHPGKGLGLSNAKEYLKNIGGRLKIESDFKVGTTVNLYVPLSPKPKWFSEIIVIPKNFQVVILDDENCAHTLWRNRLRTFEKKAHHFLSIASMKDWVKQNNFCVKKTVFLLDHHIRGELITGIDVIAELKGSYTYLITSHAEEHQLQLQVAELGAWLIPKQLLTQIELSVV